MTPLDSDIPPKTGVLDCNHVRGCTPPKMIEVPQDPNMMPVTWDVNSQKQLQCKPLCHFRQLHPLPHCHARHLHPVVTLLTGVTLNLGGTSM